MTNQTPNFYALLIGIDFYFPYTSPEGTYRNLQGCVRDINHVETYLKDTFNLTPNQIIKLTASASENPQQPKEPPELLPTYANIVAKFQEVTAIAQPQDQVYIHYSGHGGRAKTIYENLKGTFGLDEALVPTDIGLPNSRYLRDLELAKLLEEMVEKGLVVTMVLDSCHSGGATRDIQGDDRVRGGGFIDTTPRPTDSLVASVDELVKNWQKVVPNWQTLAKNSRDITLVNGLLPSPKGYTLLAACQDNELAYESVFEGTERNGALTYFLLQQLRKLGTQISANELYGIVSNLVHNTFQQQTPMLLGETERTFFGNQSVAITRNVTVMNIDITKNRVKLQAGQANGIKKGAEFDIFKFGTRDFNQTDKRVATVKVVELQATDCWAEVTQIFGFRTINNKLMEGMVKIGSPAVYLGPTLKQIRLVRLLTPDPQQQPPDIIVTSALEILKSVNAEGKRWIEFWSEGEKDKKIDYFVSLNASGEYVILDADKKPIHNLYPPLKIDKINPFKAAKNVINRLVHLAKYQTVIQLDNEDISAPLNGQLKIELIKSEKGQCMVLNTEDNVPILQVNQKVKLRIRNESNRTLNITALLLQPNLSIVQFYPEGGSYDVVEPKQQREVDFNPKLPENYQEGIVVIKVFATLEGTNFKFLELPALDRDRQGFGNQKPTNALEQLLAAIMDENTPKRNIKVVTYAYEEWTTEQVKVLVKKNIN